MICQKSPERSHGHNNTPILLRGFPWDSPKKHWVLKGHQYHQLLSSKVEEVSHPIKKSTDSNVENLWFSGLWLPQTTCPKFIQAKPIQKIHNTSERTHTHTHINATQEDNPTQLYLKESDKSNYPNYPEKSYRGPRADDSRAKWWKGAILLGPSSIRQCGFWGLAKFEGKTTNPRFSGTWRGGGGFLRC